MLETFVEKYPRTSQGWIFGVESFREEQALSSHHRSCASYNCAALPIEQILPSAQAPEYLLQMFGELVVLNKKMQLTTATVFQLTE